MKTYILVYFLFVLQNFSFASLENALILEPSIETFRLLSVELKSKYLNDISDQKLPDFGRDLGKGVRLDTHGLFLSVKFENLRIQPQDNSLKIFLDIRNVHLRSDRLEFKKKVLRKTFSSNCHNTHLHIARNRALPLEIDLKLNVSNNKIVSEISSVNFSIPKDDYESDGPSSCSGELGVGDLIREVVQDIIPRMRDKMEGSVRSNIRSFGPNIGEALNDFLIQKLQFSMPPNPFFTTHNFLLRLSPHSILLNSLKTKFSFNLDISPTPSPSPQVNDSVFFSDQDYGKIYFHQNILNEIIQIGINKNPIEIDEKVIKNINKQLSRKNLLLVWPELLNPQITENYLKLFIQIPQAPTFATHVQKLQFNIPKVLLNLQVQKLNKWEGYFDFAFTSNGDIQADIKDNKILFNLSESFEYNYSLQWNLEYRPLYPFYNKSLMKKKISQYLDQLKEKTLFSFKNIDIKVADKVMTIKEIKFENSYLEFQLKERIDPSRTY